jgi:hypothetical protein
MILGLFINIKFKRYLATEDRKNMVIEELLSSLPEENFKRLT